MNKKDVLFLRNVDPTVEGVNGERVDIFHNGHLMGSFAFFKFDNNFFAEIYMFASGIKVPIHNRARTSLTIEFKNYSDDAFYRRNVSPDKASLKNYGYHFLSILCYMESALVSELAAFSFERKPITFFEVVNETYGVMSTGEVGELFNDILTVNKANVCAGIGDYTNYGSRLFALNGKIYKSIRNKETRHYEQIVVYEGELEDFLNCFYRTRRFLKCGMKKEDIERDILDFTVVPVGTVITVDDEGVKVNKGGV